MKIKIIFTLINLLLIIYNSYSFTVDNYVDAKKDAVTYEELYLFITFQKYLSVIEITYDTGDTEIVNGFVNETSVCLLHEFINIDRKITKIKYIYNNNTIIMKEFESFPTYVRRRTEHIIICLVNKNDEDGTYKKMNYNSIFVSNGFLNDFIKKQHPLSTYTFKQLDTHLQEHNLGKMEDFFNDHIVPIEDKNVQFSSIKLPNNWFLMGKVNGLGSQNEFISTRYVSKSLKLNYIKLINNKYNIFLSLNEKKFKNDDVGTYVIYYVEPKHFVVFAQITKVVTIKDHYQILYIQRLYSTLNLNIYDKYSKIDIYSREDGHTLTSVSLPSSKVDEEMQHKLDPSSSNDSNHLTEYSDDEFDKKPDAKKLKREIKIIEKFTCENINAVGKYKYEDIIITVITAEQFDDIAETLGEYNIKGTYEYQNTTRNFVKCKKSYINADINSELKDFLVEDDQDINFFYPSK